MSAAAAPRDSAPRRILLVTGSLGAGHHAAARAVEERAHAVWPGVEVAWTDTLDGMGRHTGALFRAVYAGCVRRLPWLYALYFRLLWKVPPFRAGTRAVIGAWSAPGLARQLARHDPDLVVATFPEGVTGLARLRRRGRLDVPAVALVTDPAPHPLWADPRLDLHLVSTDAGAALLRRAAPGARVAVAALPVSTRFRPPAVTDPGKADPGTTQPPGTVTDPGTTQPPGTVTDPGTTQPPGTVTDPGTTQPPGTPCEAADPRRIRCEAADPRRIEAAHRSRPLVYVSCGSMAFGDLDRTCAAVLDAGADVLVSAGRVPAVRRRLDRLARSRPDGARMQVVDWVDDPAAATRRCDAVVTNAGGATALEAVACARPLLLVAPIPGHGRANADVLAAAGLATVCPGPAELTAAVLALRDPDRREAVSRRLRAFAARDLAVDVAALVPRGAGAPDGAKAAFGFLNAPKTAFAAGRLGPGPVVRAQDALFLYAATELVPQQVGGWVVVDDPARRDDWSAFLAERVRVRAPEIPLLCRRLAPPSPGQRPCWTVDAAPDPRRHVRPDVVEIGADGPGSSWAEVATDFFATPVDPVATGWELQVAVSPAAGQMAVLVRLHHALGDGLAVTDAIYRLLADDPAATVAPVDRPGPGSAARRALGRALLLVRGVAGLARAGRAGPSPFTGRVADPAHRRLAVGLDGARVRAAARRHGVGTTALLLGVVAEALHGLLADRGAGVAAGARVRAMVPMTARTRGGIDSRAPGNRTGAVPVDLPVGPMPPGERVARVDRALCDGRAGGRPEAAAAVLVLLGLLPAGLQARLVRMVYGRRFFHVLASVMPGLRRPVRLRGGRIREVYPLLPLADGVGLAVGALNWGGRTCVGITADPGIVPECATLPRRIQAALEALDATALDATALDATALDATELEAGP